MTSWLVKTLVRFVLNPGHCDLKFLGCACAFLLTDVTDAMKKRTQFSFLKDLKLSVQNFVLSQPTFREMCSFKTLGNCVIFCAERACFAKFWAGFDTFPTHLLSDTS